MRNSNKDALFVIFYDPWVNEVNLDDYRQGDLTDLDRPQGILKSTSQRRERVPYHGVKLIQNKNCLRKEFADYLGDKSPEGTDNIIFYPRSSLFAALIHSTKFCCSFCHPENPLDLRDFLPGFIFSLPPIDTSNKRKRAPAKTYRPTKERGSLDFRLIQWLEAEHASDPLRSVRPMYFILSDSQRANLVRAPSKEIKSASDIKTFLGESDEWAAEWAEKLFSVVQKYDQDLDTCRVQNKRSKR